MSTMEKTRSLLDMLGIKAPDIRAWVAFGCFALVYRSLVLIGAHRELLDNPAFMAFIGSLATGTVIVVVQNMFGGTKSGADTNTALAKAVGTGSGAGGAT